MGWKWPWARRPEDDGARLETRSASLSPGFVALHMNGGAVWTRGDYAALAREGFMRNPVVHRSVRMIAQAAATIPWLLYEDGEELTEHPLLDLIARPNARQSGPAFLEGLYGHLMMAGNAYAELVETPSALSASSCKMALR